MVSSSDLSTRTYTKSMFLNNIFAFDLMILNRRFNDTINVNLSSFDASFWVSVYVSGTLIASNIYLNKIKNILLI